MKMFNRLAGIVIAALAGMSLVCGTGGCGSAERKDDKFFTSGNREADQRAEQRIAKDQQLKGESDGKATSADAKAAQQAGKKSLYDRLGGDQGLRAIVDDFVPRAMNDPRVNWERKGVKQGGFSLKRNKSVEWQATPEKIDGLK